MKKVLLVFASVLLLGSAFSQGVKLGLNLNPGFLINRVQDPKSSTDTFNYFKKGVGFKFTAGPDIHIMFSENYGIALGVWYAAKRVGISVKEKVTGAEFIDTYNLQYVELPFSLQMYTNEIATDMRLYFQIGGTFDIKLASKNKKLAVADNPIITKFGRFDATILAGAGVEMQMGSDTYLMGGLRYQRSLINNASKYIEGVDEFKVNSDFLSLNIGVKF